MVRKIPLSDMPTWPRFLSRDQAAAYVGVSVGMFDAEVKDGVWPKPMRRRSRVTWDRFALDRRADTQSGLEAENDNDDIGEHIRGWEP